MENGVEIKTSPPLRQVCFLCKQTSEITEEHVFPQWLQRKYNLWNQSISLKNGSKLKYGKLTVPCCQDCNTKYLSQIEQKISEFIKCGDVINLLANQDILFIWLYKVMYGVNYKEMFLRDDIKNPESESIVNPETFFERNSYNIFPLFARKKVFFENFSPYSIFVFRIKDSTDATFYYADEPYKMFTSIILGKVGIICSFQDDGYIKSDIEKRLKISQRGELTLPEFGDFASFVLYLKIRMRILPNYICKINSDGMIFTIQEMTDLPLYSDFEPQKLFELVQRMYSFCFQKLITKDETGQPIIKYRSPFIYF